MSHSLSDLRRPLRAAMQTHMGHAPLVDRASDPPKFRCQFEGDAALEVTVSETNTFRFIGFGHSSAWTGATGIDFSFRLQSGRADIYEANVWKADNLATTGDVLQIVVTSGVARYYKNGALLYTSTRLPVYPMAVDASLIDSNATVSNVQMSGATAES